MYRNLKNIPPAQLMEQSPSLSSNAAEEVAPLSSEKPNEKQAQKNVLVEEESISFSDPLKDILRPQPPQPPKPLSSSVPPQPPSSSNSIEKKSKSTKKKRKTFTLMDPLQNVIQPDALQPPNKKKRTQRKRDGSRKKNAMNVSKMEKMVKMTDNIDKLGKKYSVLGSHIGKIQERYNKMAIEHPVNVDFKSTLKYSKKMENKIESLREKISQQTSEIEKEIVWT